MKLHTRLIVLRGNSGCGKTGASGCGALVEQVLD